MFLGGEEEDLAYDLALDSNGDVYVTGSTRSPDFPVTRLRFKPIGDLDGFVARFDGDLRLKASVCVGGAAYDHSSNVLIARNGDVFISGTTSSRNFQHARPARKFAGGGYDGFVMRLSAQLDEILSFTFFGGRRADGTYLLEEAKNGEIIFGSWTNSSDIPISNVRYRAKERTLNIFLVRMDRDLRKVRT